MNQYDDVMCPDLRFNGDYFEYLGMHLAPVITILFLIFPRMILTVFQVIIHNRANRHCLSDQALEE